MPLRIELKPLERCIIGGTAIRNGKRRSSFTVETATKFLREADIITEREATTPCKRLYLALEMLYLADDPVEPENAFVALANEIMAAVPTTRPYVLAIHNCLADRDYYRALKRAKDLVAYEASLADRLAALADPAAA